MHLKRSTSDNFTFEAIGPITVLLKHFHYIVFKAVFLKHSNELVLVALDYILNHKGNALWVPTFNQLEHSNS